jgi:serine/threonine-protein kinase RsbW
LRTPQSGYSIVSVMTIAGGGQLTRCYPAVPGTVPQARRALTEFAESAGATDEQIEAIRLATSEAVTNAVVHAYAGRPGEIHVSAAVAGDELWVLVADDGRGLHPREDSPGLGMGLALISDASDGFAIVNRSTGGTEIRMRFGLQEATVSDQDYEPESSASAVRPASSVFSTTT